MSTQVPTLIGKNATTINALKTYSKPCPWCHVRRKHEWCLTLQISCSNLLAWPILGHLWYVAPLLWYCQGACLRGAAHTNRGQSEGSLPKDQGARQWKDVKRLHARFMPGHGLIQLSWRCKSCHEENHNISHVLGPFTRFILEVYQTTVQFRQCANPRHSC